MNRRSSKKISSIGEALNGLKNKKMAPFFNMLALLDQKSSLDFIALIFFIFLMFFNLPVQNFKKADIKSYFKIFINISSFTISVQNPAVQLKSALFRFLKVDYYLI